MKLAESDQAQLLAVFNRGAAKSAERLTALSGAPWGVCITSLDVGTGTRFLSILTRDAREYFGAVFSSPGEDYAVLFSEESGRALLEASPLGRRNKRRALPGMEQSALAEIANVLIHGLSGELADRHGMIRVLPAPATAWGRKAAIYDRAFGGLSGDQAMVDVLIHISSPLLSADCTVLLRLDAVNANFLLNTDPDVISRSPAGMNL